jgi:hypothetical protein
MVRVTDADMKAINYLNDHSPTNLLVEGYTFYFGRFLPDWPINYLWTPTTQQNPNIRTYNPLIERDLAYLKKFGYIYVIDNQIGWTPAAIKFNFVDNYLSSPDLELVCHQKSRTNEVYLFKVVR